MSNTRKTGDICPSCKEGVLELIEERCTYAIDNSTNNTLPASKNRKTDKHAACTNTKQLTVGELKQRLKDVPDDIKVYYQVIEDFYFEENGWHSISLPRVEYPDDTSEYVEAFHTYVNSGYFVIEAHY